MVWFVKRWNFWPIIWSLLEKFFFCLLVLPKTALENVLALARVLLVIFRRSKKFCLNSRGSKIERQKSYSKLARLENLLARFARTRKIFAWSQHYFTYLFHSKNMSTAVFFCTFIHHYNPFLKMGPFKFEAKHQNPEIGFFHDFVSTIEIEWWTQIMSLTTSKKELCFT